jgi:hypothetical protein
MPKKKLPKPACQLGYTNNQLDEILGTRRKDFSKWLHGQTVALCDGRNYNSRLKTYVDSGCGPHGLITYTSDLIGFLNGSPVLD